MVAKKFQINVVKITEDTFVSQKTESVAHASKQNSPPGWKKLSISPEQHFLKISFLQNKGWMIIELKK